ncbi:hypothetical protein [Methanothermobacter tenebrarum]|uniref:DUF2178 domain-containing protein n=1 Tax=Methanothermobacter tenebrarum TaxID=680118 RepID=A0A328PIZ8_9EURY|nr:hypothetical protein [Methanothermobacter tenebrarum]NPV65324.1 hypothetical protein [Methanobacteriaceae archaeon]RAO79676.1 hypothetical protein DPC56_02640 [Methanothermobacter tenebrarum]
MIIARPEWFGTRKYGGWGISIKTWQGAVYIAGVVSFLVLIQLTPLNTEQRAIITGAWLIFVFIDLFDVMWKVKKDEREYLHEAIAERNAAWAMMTILVIGILTELLYNAMQKKIYVDPFMITALIIGAIVKSITYYKLEKEA